LKRETYIRELLDVCLHNAVPHLIYENQDLFSTLLGRLSEEERLDLIKLQKTIQAISSGGTASITYLHCKKQVFYSARFGNLEKIQRDL